MRSLDLVTVHQDQQLQDFNQNKHLCCLHVTCCVNVPVMWTQTRGSAHISISSAKLTGSNVLTATSALINKHSATARPDRPPGLRAVPDRGAAAGPGRGAAAGPGLLTCFGFIFARCRACGAGTGRNLGAGAAVGDFLHVCLRVVRVVEAELRAESRRAL